LGPVGYAAAARTTLNAHYTDARIVRPLWQAVQRAGVDGGIVLEPGVGRGSFVADAPGAFRVLGVELDPATARVADALSDERHAIVQADFAELRLVPAAAAVVGNVPFGKYALFDPEHNPRRRLSIHDHFIAKSVAALRPGGVAVLVTSRYTLDKLDGAARTAIGERADFLGAVRLPSHAHQAEAGTRVVTDVLVLRRRRPGEAPNHAVGWDEPPVRIAAWAGQALTEPIRISRYFIDHPEAVLGRVRVGGGLHESELLVEEGPDDLEHALDAALERIVHGASLEPTHRGLGQRFVIVPTPEDLIRDEQASRGPLGRIERTETGLFQRLDAAGWEPHKPPTTQRDELAALVRLRDLADDLVALESHSGVPDALLNDARTRLRAAWERYVARWGPVNRARINEETGARSYPQMGGFRSDPGWPRVAALEVYDQTLGTAEPASIMHHRLIVASEPPEQVDDPADALALSLARVGQVDIEYIAALLDTGTEEAIDALGERVFRDPATGQWATAEDYLSGNARQKLRTAQEAAQADASFERNVAALSDTVPRDVTADELAGTLGAPWVPVEVVEEFARSLCPSNVNADEVTVARDNSVGRWTVGAPSVVRWRMQANHEFGLEHYDALRLLESALNGRSPVVKRNDTVDVDATTQAVDLAEDLGDRFDQWLLHDDAERARGVVAAFNERFNAHVPRSYQQAADAISAEGLRSDFVLRPHQRQAIARIVYGGNTLLAHPVGAGKTAEMIVGAMELRRLGMIRLPCFVVPNHLLEQFAASIVDLYPAAQVLAISKDQFNRKGRATFAAKVRSHDWDAVVITHASFTRWSLSPDAETTGLQAKLAVFNQELERLTRTKGKAAATLTKQLERRKANYEARLKESREDRERFRDDHAFYFDQSGIDWVAIDEAQEFKNAEIQSSARNLRGVPTGNARLKADDLDAKLAWLRDARPGRPTVTFATATPISNTAAELWVMGRYLRPDLLDEVGIGAFDSFRLAFCDTTSAMELDVSGAKFKRVERLARYKNLPELARIWGEFVDVVTIDQLDLPRPTLDGGQRDVVVIPRSPELATFMRHEISRRADAVHNGEVAPGVDNHLKITSDARLASFDWQTYSGEPVEDRYSTLVAAADNIARIYHDNRDRTYRTATGQLHPRPGAFQLVFSDLGTPKPGRTDTAYDRLRGLLIARGVPAAQIGFIHEHDKGDKADEAKARFFAACRDGRVAVAVSSTPKMGMGTNVQDRLLALHHLDCPWRPSDIEQREGRIIRQGNQCPVVQIYAYATEQSFAVNGWQTIERKAGFVGQIMRADPNGPRVLEPDDAEALAYGQIKAIATGDPDFLTLADLEDKLARLERLQRGHHQEQAALARQQNAYEDAVAYTNTRIARLRGPAEIIEAQRAGALLPLRVGGTRYTNRGDAARALGVMLSTNRTARSLMCVEVGESGHWVGWKPFGDSGGSFGIRDLDLSVLIDDTEHSTLVGALTRIINGVQAVPDRVRYLEDVALADAQAQLERTRSARGAPFPHSDELRDIRHRVGQLRQALEQRYADEDRAAPARPPTPDAAGPAPASTSDADAMRRRLDAVAGRRPPDLGL
jgi:N12 class adenine-specific DNA methylase